MNPRRFAAVASVLTAVLAGWVVAWLAGFGSAGIENTGAAPIIESRPASLAADVELADAPRAAAMGNAAAESTDMATPAASVADARAASDKPKSSAEAALADSSQTPQPKTQPVQVATANTSDTLPNDAKQALSSVEIPDECPAANSCIDRYLWSLYQRTPKEDTIKV